MDLIDSLHSPGDGPSLPSVSLYRIDEGHLHFSYFLALSVHYYGRVKLSINVGAPVCTAGTADFFSF